MPDHPLQAPSAHDGPAAQAEDHAPAEDRAPAEDCGPAEDRGPAEGLAAALGAVLFVAGEPVPAARLADLVGAAVPEVREALEALGRRLEGSGLWLRTVAGGYQLGTRPEHAEVVRRYLQTAHGERLSRGALETLAVIAYRQPVTRGEIEAIRGVSSDWHIERLLERQLIREVGRRQTVGRPTLFGTTEQFLRYFGLNDLSELPPMGERGVQVLLDSVR